MDQPRPASKRQHSGGDKTPKGNTHAAAAPSTSGARKSRKPSASATPSSASRKKRVAQQQEDAGRSGPSSAGPSSRAEAEPHEIQGHDTGLGPTPRHGSLADAQEAEPRDQHQEHQNEGGEQQGGGADQAEGSTGDAEPPPTLTEDRLRNAVDRLSPLLGENNSRRNFAEHALRTVLESNTDLDKDEERWVEEAQVWVACNSEMEAEIEQLRDAMAASLADAQARKALEAKDSPDPDELLTKHCNTQLMKKVSCVVCPHLMVACLVKEEKDTYKALSRLLDQEVKCCKHWYPAPGTRYFFQRLAEEVAGGLQAQAQAVLALSDGASSSAAGPEPSSTPLLRCDASAGCSKCGDVAQGAPSRSLAELWRQLGQLLKIKDQQVAQGLAELPPKLGDTGFIPSIFRIPEGAPPDAGAQVFGEGDTKDCCIELD